MQPHDTAHSVRVRILRQLDSFLVVIYVTFHALQLVGGFLLAYTLIIERYKLFMVLVISHKSLHFSFKYRQFASMRQALSLNFAMALILLKLLEKLIGNIVIDVFCLLDVMIGRIFITHYFWTGLI